MTVSSTSVQKRPPRVYRENEQDVVFEFIPRGKNIELYIFFELLFIYTLYFYFP